MTRESVGRKLQAKLRTLAKDEPGKTINELRIIVALERAVARIDNLPELAKHVVFKGGFVLLKTLDTNRFTRDLDALAVGLPKAAIPPLVKKALQIDLKDGLWYGDPVVTPLVAQKAYGGWRFVMPFQIGEPPSISKGGDKKLSRVTVEIGIGDKIPSHLPQILMPSLSHEEPVLWKIYPPEYIFAEKLEALFSRGDTNSRAKDIYDLNLLFPKCEKKKQLLQAIKSTFQHRGTELPSSFFETASTMSLITFQRAWPAVDISGDKPPFEKVWDFMLNYLKILDAEKESL